MMPLLPVQAPARRGFTLVELLVATSVLMLLIVLLAAVLRSTSTVWERSGHRIDAFRDARAALRLMTDDLRGTLRSQGIPSLVLQNVFTESDIAGMKDNAQVYALITRPNEGRSDVCAVGYYCTWNEDARAYELRRSFADSDTTYERIAAAGASPEGYTSISIFKPSPTTDEILVQFAWNLKIVPIDGTGQAMASSAPIVFGQNVLPAALEVSFDAISPKAVRALAPQRISSDFWFAPQSHIYRNQIAPAMQRFRTRIDLALGGGAPDA